MACWPAASQRLVTVTARQRFLTPASPWTPTAAGCSSDAIRLMRDMRGKAGSMPRTPRRRRLASRAAKSRLNFAAPPACPRPPTWSLPTGARWCTPCRCSPWTFRWLTRAFLDHGWLGARGPDLFDRGLTWGSHSNNHFDILGWPCSPMGSRCRRARQGHGHRYALDLADGYALTQQPPQIKGGFSEVPKTPGLSVTVDREALQARQRPWYLNTGLRA